MACDLKPTGSLLTSVLLDAWSSPPTATFQTLAERLPKRMEAATAVRWVGGGRYTPGAIYSLHYTECITVCIVHSAPLQTLGPGQGALMYRKESKSIWSVKPKAVVKSPQCQKLLAVLDFLASVTGKSWMFFSAAVTSL